MNKLSEFSKLNKFTYNADKIFIDTDIVIFLLKKEAKFVQPFLDFKNNNVRFFYNPIIKAEIYAGAFKNEYTIIEQFFSYLECIDIDEEIGKEAGLYANEFRKSHSGISLEDFIIAATVKTNNMILWANNVKHYPMKNIKLFDNF
jgi:hypothetical protein